MFQNWDKAFIAVCFCFFAENSPLWDKKKMAMKTRKEKFRKNPENSPIFEEFSLGLASFRQSVLPCRQYVNGFPEFSTCLSDLWPNLKKSSPAWWPVHLLLKIEKKTLVHSFREFPFMQQLYGKILADAPCVCGVIHGPVVAEFFLGKISWSQNGYQWCTNNGDHPQGDLGRIGQ
jgi:hypothetical protein